MRAGITALILSAQPHHREIPGLEVVNYVSQFNDAAGLLDSRINSIGHVKTSHFFWLDDDDYLPDDYLDVLEECLAADKPLVYTREEVYRDGRWFVRNTAPYSQAVHAANPMLVHHLTLCQTVRAAEAWRRLPRGCYAPEPLLYYELATQGVAFVDRVGYRWNRGQNGLSRKADIIFSQYNALKYNQRRWEERR